MIYQEKLPYLFTILILALGWTLTHLVEQFGSSPIIEYKKHLNKSETELVYNISNISHATRFDKIQFYILLSEDKPGRCMEKPKLVLPPPTHLGKNKDEPVCKEGQSVEFILTSFQPGSEISIAVTANDKTDGSLRIYSNDTIKLIESSLITYMVKHQLSLLVLLVIVWVSLLAIYYHMLNTKTRYDC